MRIILAAVVNFNISSMNKSEMVEQMVNYYTDGNKAKFAKLLGVSPQTISSWIARGTFDAELVYAKCREINADWLLTGEEPMIDDYREKKHNGSKERKDDEFLAADVDSYEDDIVSENQDVKYNSISYITSLKIKSYLETLNFMEKEIEILNEQIVSLKQRLHYLKEHIS